MSFDPIWRHLEDIAKIFSVPLSPFPWTAMDIRTGAIDNSRKNISQQMHRTGWYYGKPILIAQCTIRERFSTIESLLDVKGAYNPEKQTNFGKSTRASILYLLVRVILECKFRGILPMRIVSIYSFQARLHRHGHLNCIFQASHQHPKITLCTNVKPCCIRAQWLAMMEEKDGGPQNNFDQVSSEYLFFLIGKTAIQSK